MTVIHAETALLPSGWVENVEVTIAGDGRIASVSGARAGRHADHRTGLLLPAPANVHSHAFQRAMAGLAERRGKAGEDSFWTWRALMFRFLERLTPEDIEALAAQVQMEMLEAGFAAVGEFHYLHHQPDGTPYSDLAETGARICAAARETGIGLTLLPVLYQRGGADGRPLGSGQRRFGNMLERFLTLHDATARHLAALPDDCRLGAAPHSLRAVAPEALAEIARATTGPLHMHLAEQQAEVDEIRAAYGARPVRYLLDTQPPDGRWCLVHCTRMTAAETRALAATGAIAGLCPITEASLGDGIFDGARWLEQGGAIGIGSDSNIRINLSEELRLLEYSQRLRDRRRAVLAEPGGSTGRRLFDAACAGGARALGRDGGTIAPGRRADLLALDATHPDLAGRHGDSLLDTWIFATGDRLVRDVWSAGRHVVRDGRHVARDRITARWRVTLSRLAEAL